LGDAVNLASRLENLTGYYGVGILVSDTACRLGASDLAVIEIDTVRVKGREHPERIWAILGGPDLKADRAFQSFRDRFSTALDAYRQKDWASAKDRFGALAEAAAPYGFDDVIERFVDRSTHFGWAPPAPDWDGVWQTQKM